MKIKNKKIAKNLIKLGINVDDIVKATGLSKDEVEELTKKNNFQMCIKNKKKCD